MKTSCTPTLLIFALLGVFCIGGAISSGAAEQPLFDFTGSFDPAPVVATDAKVTIGRTAAGSVLRVETGHEQLWPGITLRAPAGPWDLSSCGEVAVQLRNSGSNAVTVSCRVDNEGADGQQHCVTGSLNLGMGQTGTLTVPLKRSSDEKLDGRLFGMRGYPVKASGPGTVDPSRVTQLLVFVTRPSAGHSFELSKISGTGQHTPPTAWVTDAEPFFPFIDHLGQYRHKNWPGKVKSVAELAERRRQEAQELTAQPGPRDWDQYGGSSRGPQLKATGFFRTEKVNGKWWLVNPDGRLFFSHGVDCVRMLDTTPTEERASWFKDFPGDEPQFSEFLTRGYALKGHYAGKTVQCFSFAGANLLRKYGSSWRQSCPEVIHKRLRSWGLNTIANWSDENIRLMRLTPYTDTVGSGRAKMLEGSEGYWGKFPDVFDPSFAESLRRSMEPKKAKSAGDPWCIGYFSDNEMSWGDECSLALAALRSGPSQAAKRTFVGELKAKYGEIGKLNATWGTPHPSWEALETSREAPDKEKARADLETFYTRMAEQYFRSVRDAIKAVAPNQLYLGCRFAWVNDRAAAAAAKYCDVVSYNLYRRSVADFKFNGGADVPLIIGEFHFGALDRGMFHTGLVPVATQEARAQAYGEYVLGALRHPQFVGCHWFQYQDEPTTGRVFDEENYQIGFVDIADTPYRETIAASREMGERLYKP
jgi:hypothetical protein